MAEYASIWQREEDKRRWVAPAGDADGERFLSLRRRDTDLNDVVYKSKRLVVDETGTYVVTPDGSVTVRMHRLDGQMIDGGGTYLRRGNALHAAMGPSPWVRWHKGDRAASPARTETGDPENSFSRKPAKLTTN